MNPIEQLVAHLTALDLRFQRADDGTLMLLLRGEQTVLEVVIRDHGPLVLFSVPRLAAVPSSRIDEAVRLANLINATRLLWGVFWVHPSHRFLGFELPLPAVSELSRETVECALTRLNAADDWFPTFARVLWAGCLAEEALVSSEGADLPTGEDGEDDGEVFTV